MDTMSEPITFWKQKTLTRHQVYYHITNSGNRLQNWLDATVWDHFMQWHKEQNPDGVDARVLADWADEYLVFDNVYTTWLQTRLVNA